CARGEVLERTGAGARTGACRTRGAHPEPRAASRAGVASGEIHTPDRRWTACADEASRIAGRCHAPDPQGPLRVQPGYGGTGRATAPPPGPPPPGGTLTRGAA